MASPIGDGDTDTFPILTEADTVEAEAAEAAAATAEASAIATTVSDAPAEWQVGDIVAGRFVVEQRLRSGRYGTVFKALDRALSDPLIGVEHHVALEDLPRRIAEQPTFVERLGQLRLQPQSWSHPNIAKVLEFGRDGTRYFFCEQLLDGASLRFVLDASAPNALEEHEVLGILRYVGDALSYAHAKGIVHGDLRLDDVFVTEAYEVKLTGFLPSVELRPEPVFVEDGSNGGQPHSSDDVYGLACLAYELLTRRHPYDGKTPVEALRMGLTVHPALNLSPPRWQALSRGLALRREQRTATIAELLAGLGVTGVETLKPVPQNIESAAPPPREAAIAEATLWPEITEATPAPSFPRFDAPPSAAPHSSGQASAERRAELFAEMYPEPTARLVRDRRGRRRAAPLGTILGVLLAAGLATFAYLNHAWLRDRAASFMEAASAPVSPRSTPPAAAPAATEPPAALQATETAPPGPSPVSASAPVSEPAPATVAPAPSQPTAPVRAITQQPAAAAAAVGATSQLVFAERTLIVNEWEGSARLVIQRTGPLGEEASFVWWTTDGTAVADDDYALLGARVGRFKAGEDTQVLHVPLIADSLPEGRESFVVNARSERAGGAAAQLEVVVLDDDR